MRLQKHEIHAIKRCFNKYFSNGKIFLFGSRVDDSIKGGDIDLYIKTEKTQNIRENKLRFLVDLKSIIGDQKIDVVLSNDQKRTIDREAQSNGILL